MGSAPSELSMVRVTSARPSGGRPAVPAKITSSILPPRSALAPCSPNTHMIASTTFDLPDPLGPTTQVIPGSRRSSVTEAKDLKPFSVRRLRCTLWLASRREHRNPNGARVQAGTRWTRHDRRGNRDVPRYRPPVRAVTTRRRRRFPGGAAAARVGLPLDERGEGAGGVGPALRHPIHS